MKLVSQIPTKLSQLNRVEKEPRLRLRSATGISEICTKLCMLVIAGLWFMFECQMWAVFVLSSYDGIRDPVNSPYWLESVDAFCSGVLVGPSRFRIKQTKGGFAGRSSVGNVDRRPFKIKIHWLVWGI